MTDLEKLWAKHRAKHAARVAAPKTPAADIVPETGPGTELRKMLHGIGINPKGPKCKCNEHAREMDRRGVDWCTENVESIVDWLEEEAKKRPLIGILFSRNAARMVVRKAIERAR